MGLGSEFDTINNAFDIMGITPRGWDMTQDLIILSAKATQYKLDTTTSAPTAPTTTPTTPTQHPSDHHPTTPALPTRTGIPTHVGTVPLDDFKRLVKQDIGTYKFFTDPTLEQTKYISAFPTGCYYCRMRNHGWDLCNALKWIKTKTRVEYDATVVSRTPPVPTPTAPIVPPVGTGTTFAPSNLNPNDTSTPIFEYPYTPQYSITDHLLACTVTTNPTPTNPTITQAIITTIIIYFQTLILRRLTHLPL